MKKILVSILLVLASASVFATTAPKAKAVKSTQPQGWGLDKATDVRTIYNQSANYSKSILIWVDTGMSANNGNYYDGDAVTVYCNNDKPIILQPGDQDVCDIDQSSSMHWTVEKNNFTYGSMGTTTVIETK